MSGMEVLAVVACVAAVCSAYHDGAEILQQIRAKRKARNAAHLDAFAEGSTQELELSLARGEDVVQSQYDRDYKRFGQAFAGGDDIAKEALKDIIIHLQAQVITNLKAQWLQETYIDFTALQDVSDSSQDKAIVILMQLQQRIITSGPIENLKPPPLFAPPWPGFSQENPPSRRISGNVNLLSGSNPDSTYYANEHPSSFQNAPVAQSNGWHKRSASSTLDTRSSQQVFPVPGGRPALQAPPIQYHGNSRPSTPVEFRSSHQRPSPGYGTDMFGSASPISSDGSWTSPPAYLAPRVVTTITSSGNEKNEKGHFVSVSRLKLFGTRSKATPVTMRRNESPRIKELSHDTVPRHEPPRIKELEAPWSSTPTDHTVQQGRTQNAEPAKAQRLKEHPPPPPTRSSSIFSDITATESSYEPPETPDFNPWAERSLPATPATIRTLNESSRPPTLRSSGSIHGATRGTICSKSSACQNPKDLLPNEENKFQGYCKGAWRHQIGDKKKAMDDRQRPGDNAARFWQCSKCKFEGHMVMLDKKTKAVDRRVLTAEGLQFRWDFLFKSHIETKDATTDFLSATFGCMFCTAEGRGTPTFGSAQMLMAHFQDHREKLPSGEVLYRMNALVGPRAALEEDFDINLVGKEGNDISYGYSVP